MDKRKKRLYLVHSQSKAGAPSLQTTYGRMSTSIQNALHAGHYLEAISLCELAMTHCLGVRRSLLQSGCEDNPEFESINSLILDLINDGHGLATETDQVATVLYAQVRDWYEDKCRRLPGLMIAGLSGGRRDSDEPLIETVAEKGLFLWQLMAALMEHLNSQHHQQDRIARYS
jgi:hypothetical protein